MPLCIVRGSSRASSTVTKGDNVNTTSSNMKGSTSVPGTARKYNIMPLELAWYCGMFSLASVAVLDTPHIHIVTGKPYGRCRDHSIGVEWCPPGYRMYRAYTQHSGQPDQMSRDYYCKLNGKWV